MDNDTILSILKMVNDKTLSPGNADELINKIRGQQHSSPSALPFDPAQKIAVIGIACRFPGAENPVLFWRNLCRGVDSVKDIPHQRWKSETCSHSNKESNRQAKDYCPKGGLLENFLSFDPDFFGFTNTDILEMDPQHLLALEIAWEAFENAGYGKTADIAGEIGVFWGARGTTRNVADLTGKDKHQAQGRNSVIGNAQNMIAARISDYFNFQGPSIVVDTACSSSLVSIHLACQSIVSGESDIALAGGVDLLTDQHAYDTLRQAHALSPDGKCFTFDKRANGYVPGEGGGAVLLKPLHKAIQDHDTIYSVILGTAVNNDGHTMGITTPSLDGQKAVIKKALRRAGVTPDTISYVETHGTGTTIGDPIEMKALTDIFQSYTDQKGFCGIGSVKTNIGHLHSASGIAGFIKLVLSLYHKKIPSSLNCHEPNPRFNLLHSPFYPVAKLADWHIRRGVRRGAVSSFGFGGTNAHVIVQDYTHEEKCRCTKKDTVFLFCLSAKSVVALRRLMRSYEHFLSDTQESLRDICFTALTGRERFAYRWSALVKSKEELLSKLRSAEIRWRYMHETINNLDCVNGDPDFKFSYGNARRIALPTYPFVRKKYAAEDNCIPEFNIGQTIIDGFSERNGQKVTFFSVFHSQEDWILNHHRIADTLVLSGAGIWELFIAAFSHFSSQHRFILKEIFHKVPVSAAADTVIMVKTTVELDSTGTTATLLYWDHRKMQWVGCTEGFIERMNNETAPSLDIAEIKTGLKKHHASVDDFYRAFAARNMHYGPGYRGVKRLWKNDHEALGMIELPEFLDESSDTYFCHPSLIDSSLQVISVLLDNDQEKVTYVPFYVNQISIYSRLPSCCYSYVTKREHTGKDMVVHCDITITDTYGNTVLTITDVNLKPVKSSVLNHVHVRHTNTVFKDTFIRPTWLPLDIHTGKISTAKCALLFLDKDNALHMSIYEKINTEIAQCILVTDGQNFQKVSSSRYIINPASADDYYQLFMNLSADAVAVEIILHVWTFTAYENRIGDRDTLLSDQIRGVYSVLHIVQSLHKVAVKRKITLAIVSSYSQVTDTHTVMIGPEKAPLLGIVQTIPHEFQNIDCIHIDIEYELQSQLNENAAVVILDELNNTQKELFVAYRENRRLVRRLETFDPLQQPLPRALECRENGVYIIAGGLSGIGFELAKHLAAQKKVALVFISRKGFLPQSEWKTVTDAPQQAYTDDIKRKIGMIRAIQDLGSEVMIQSADITDLENMKECIKNIKQRYAKIHGIFHVAGVLKDSLLVTMTMDDFRNVLYPKLLGSWVLDTVCKDEDIDFLILFSGLVTFFGNAGQSNHAAADYFEDSFAYFRNNVMKKSTQVINWGIWKDTGGVADPFYIEKLHDLGFLAMETEKALGALEIAMQSGVTQVGIGQLREEKMKESIINCNTRSASSPDRLFYQLLEMCRYREQTIFEHADFQANLQFGKKLHKLCGLFVVNFFKNLGMQEHHDTLSLDDIIAHLGVQPPFLQLLHVLLTIAEEEGFLRRSENRYAVCTANQYDSPETVCEALKHDYPQKHAFMDILHGCFSHYHEIMQGKLDPVSVLFPKGSGAFLRKLYQLESPYEQLIGEIVQFYLRHHSGSDPVKILEIGTGTGGLTAKVISAVKRYTVDYYATDISPVLINEARQLYGESSCRFGIYDLNKSPELQGYANEKFHIVLGANVFHISRDLKKTLSEMKQLLVPDGVLIMLETTMQTRFADLVFGITKDWWKPEEFMQNGRSVVLPAHEWKQKLITAGFVNIVALPFDTKQTIPFPFSVIAAHAPDTITLTDKVQHEDRQPTIEQTKTEQSLAKYTIENVHDFIRRFLSAKIAALLEKDPADIDPDTGFLSLGLDSLSLVNIAAVVEKEAGIKLYPTLFFEYQTVYALSDYLDKHFQKEFAHLRDTVETAPAAYMPEVQTTASSSTSDILKSPYCKSNNGAAGDIAIIGLAGIFPGAKDINAYWDNLTGSKNCIVGLHKKRWESLDYYDPRIGTAGKTYCKWAGLIDSIDEFDAGFFNISPKEANKMDPQQRLMLETVYHALEHAGYGGSRLYHTKTGVFVGVSNHHYSDQSFDPHDSFSVLGGQNGMVANRISYFFNVKGPSLVIDTQCSSSLVALHYACSSIKTGECDQAIVGGVNIGVPVAYYRLLSQIRALSPDGKCKTFDKSANGFVSGEGVCAVIVKPLSNAIKDRDIVHAVIKGSAVNHGGTSSGLTAPNVNAQCSVIEEALARSGVDAGTVSYIETHGTGTALGDPVEITALGKAFARYTQKKGFCALGAVKTNIGHLEAAAGLAGLIKTVLAMKYTCIPPTLHVKQPNPHLDLTSTPFFVTDRPIPWNGSRPLRAGVSAFGIGGTNAHVILQEPPSERKEPLQSEATQYHALQNILTISAKQVNSLKRNIGNLLQYICDNETAELTDMCHTYNTGRGHFNHRVAIVTETISDLKTALADLSRNGLQKGFSPDKNTFYHSIEQDTHNDHSKISFIYTPHIVSNDGEIAHVTEYGIFRNAIRQCESHLHFKGRSGILDFLPHSSDSVNRNSETMFLNRAAIFTLQYAYTQLLKSWGIIPDIVMGFEQGEYAAAVAAELLDIDTALTMIKNNSGEIKARRSNGKTAFWGFDHDTVSRVGHDQEQRYGLGQTPYDSCHKEIVMKTMEKTGIRLSLLFEEKDEHSNSFMTNAETFDVSPFLSFGSREIFSSRALMKIVACVYTRGGDIDWAAFSKGYSGRIIEAPSYAFNRKKYWFSKTEEKVGTLFSKWYYRGTEIKNRILKSAVEIGCADDKGNITGRYLDFYRQWADSELGLNIAGNFIVAADARSSGTEVVLCETNPQQEQLKQLNAIVTSNGSRLVVQLNHAGADTITDEKVFTTEKIHRCIEQFVHAAHLVHSAGCFGVQIHAANNFLISRFLSGAWNLRTDQWGGILENRMKVLVRIIEGIRRKEGAGFFISVKVGRPEDTKEIDELITGAEVLKENGVDLLEISSGLDNGLPDYRYTMDVCGSIKNNVDIPLAITGKLTDLDQLTEVIETGLVEMAGMARPVICEPELIPMLKTGKARKSQCRSCSLCMVSLQKEQGLQCFYRSNLIHTDQPEMGAHGAAARREEGVTDEQRSRCPVSTRWDRSMYEMTSHKSAADERIFTSGIFKQHWEQSTIQGTEIRCKTWLIIGQQSDLMTTLVQRMRDNDYTPVQVQFTEEYRCDNDTRFSVRPLDQSDYKQIMAHVIENTGDAFGIIHLGAATNDNDTDYTTIEEKLNKSVYSLFLLSRELIGLKQACAIPLITITANAWRINENDRICPENGTTTALSRIIPHEARGIVTKTIDFSFDTDAYACKNMADTIIDEVKRCVPVCEEIAYRNNRRMSRKITQCTVSDFTNHPMPVPWQRSNAYYVIIGGLSGLGSVMSHHFARNKCGGLIITGRTALPPEKEWEEFTRHHQADHPVSAKITTLKDLRKQGIDVLYYSVDVSDYNEMNRMVSEIKRKGKRISGIIHCAGILDKHARSIRSKSLESFRKTLLPKVHGTLVLEKVFNDISLEFMVYCSSLAAVQGSFGAGLSDYSVANFFMDRFAEKQSANVHRVLSVNWALWNGIGHGASKNQGIHTFPLEKDRGVEAFNYLLDNGMQGNVIVVDHHTASSFQKIVNTSGLVNADRAETGAEETAVRYEENQYDAYKTGERELSSRHLSSGDNCSSEGHMHETALKDECESFIENLLVKLLQLEPEEITANTSFSEYGIDSITVADMVGEIERCYQVSIHPADVLKYSTVNKLAGFVATLVNDKTKAALATEMQIPNIGKDEKSGIMKHQEVMPGDRSLEDILKKLSSGKLSVEDAVTKYNG